MGGDYAYDGDAGKKKFCPCHEAPVPMVPIVMENLPYGSSIGEDGQIKLVNPPPTALGIGVDKRHWDLYECEKCGFTCLFRSK